MRIFIVLGILSLLAACGETEQASETAQMPKSIAPNDKTQKTTASEVKAMGPEAAVLQFQGGLPDKTDPDWKSKVSEPAMMPFEAGQSYFWELKTNHGTMTFRLFQESAPKHVNSTVYLTQIGFYDDVLFHRVIPGFMAQGGDPTGTGRGGPGYKYDGEFAAGLSHTKPGLLSMANAGPGTDGSQFFITFTATPFLDGKHTIFGEMVDGDAVLEALEARGSRRGTTSEVLKIVSARILVQPA